MSLQGLLEPVARKRARPVLRGPRRSNAPGLPDERFFAYLTNDLLQRSDHRCVQTLEADIRAWTRSWNANPKPFVWTKTADQILESLARLLKRTNGGGH